MLYRFFQDYFKSPDSADEKDLKDEVEELRQRVLALEQENTNLKLQLEDLNSDPHQPQCEDGADREK